MSCGACGARSALACALAPDARIWPHTKAASPQRSPAAVVAGRHRRRARRPYRLAAVPTAVIGLDQQTFMIHVPIARPRWRLGRAGRGPGRRCCCRWRLLDRGLFWRRRAVEQTAALVHGQQLLL